MLEITISIANRFIRQARSEYDKGMLWKYKEIN